MRFLIINPYKYYYEPNGGTEIRIKGYTESFIASGYDYYFISPVKPQYVPEKNYVNFSLPRMFNKIMLIHNFMFGKPGLNLLSDIINFLVKRNRNIRILLNLSNDSINIIHKEQTLLLYLLLRKHTNFIFDVHGILNLQKEYSEQLRGIRKFWFKLNLLNEKRLYKLLKYVNVVNNETLSYLKSEFSFKGTGFIAPDGLLKQPEEYKSDNESVEAIRRSFKITEQNKIILFIGAFKKFGGVQFLTQAFVKLVKGNPNIKLFLIGTGQMENTVLKTIYSNNLEKQFIHQREIKYNDIINYQEIADVIVIPDIAGSYNELTPHIKFYDALISGKNLVIPDFKVNRDIASSLVEKENIHFFQPSSPESLIDCMLNVLKNSTGNLRKPALPVSMTYFNRGKEIIKIYEKEFFSGIKK